jgi:hypothetical protein
MTLKLGKHPATPRAKDLLFTRYTTGTLPKPTANFGFDAVKPADGWGMLGNDNYGDCVWAGACHEHILASGAKRPGGTKPPPAKFSDTTALSDYATVTGFDPVTGAGDDGTNVHDAMSYRQHTGILDTAGARHKIGAYVSVTPRDVTELLQAAYLLETVGIGIQFPQSAMDQFNAGQAWSIVSGSPVEGGHYVPVVGYRRGLLEVITWGRLQQMTISFYQRYNDESWGFVSTDMLEGTTTSPRGFDMQQLTNDLGQL